MKSAFFFFTTLVTSSLASAAIVCGPQALEIAQWNLDAKARAYGHPASNISANTLKLIKKSSDVIDLSVEGQIYRANYKLMITVDSSCGLAKLVIKEI